MREIGIDEYKKIVLDVMIRIDKICAEHDIPYFLFYGSLLGAMRHKGFIPWDDDIDITMKREDYNRLAEVIENGDYGLNFIRIETHPDTIYPFGKICDVRTELYEKNFRRVNGLGAGVDVFPLDCFPEDTKKQVRIGRRHFSTLKWIVHTARIGYSKTDSFVVNSKRALAMWLGGFFSPHKLVKQLNDERIRLNSHKTCHWGSLDGRTYPAEEFEESTRVEFEGYYFSAPRNPDRVLKIRYGEYMKLPPVEEQVSNHSTRCYYKDGFENQ